MSTFIKLIIDKLNTDKKFFDEEIKKYVDYIDENPMCKLYYTKASAKRAYCLELIEFFTELKDNL